jgi:hypothetical protein
MFQPGAFPITKRLLNLGYKVRNAYLPPQKHSLDLLALASSPITRTLVLAL